MLLTSSITNMSISEVFFSFIVVYTVIFTVYEGSKKCLDLFNKARKRANNIESNEEMLKRHDEEIKKVNTDLSKIVNILEKQNEDTKRTTVASFRVRLWQMHKELMEQKYVSQSDLRAWKEAKDIYVEAGGDDIVHDKLDPEVMALPTRD